MKFVCLVPGTEVEESGSVPKRATPVRTKMPYGEETSSARSACVRKSPFLHCHHSEPGPRSSGLTRELPGGDGTKLGARGFCPSWLMCVQFGVSHLPPPASASSLVKGEVTLITAGTPQF